jgi:hypothetical protein
MSISSSQKFVGGLAVLLGLLGIPGTASAAPTLQVDTNGKLTGASNVDVSGTLYDVQFKGGTCAAVFGVCNRAHFTFNSQVAADAAALALLNTVFIDGTAGQFDSFPDLTLGCVSIALCEAVTPYDTDALTAAPSVLIVSSNANNWSATSGITDSVTPNDIFLTVDQDVANGRAIYAVWITTPEPPSLGILGIGLLALLGLLRRRALRETTGTWGWMIF